MFIPTPLIAPTGPIALAVHAHRLRLTLLAEDGSARTTSPVLDTRTAEGQYTHIEAATVPETGRAGIYLNRVPEGLAEVVLGAEHGVALEAWQRVGAQDLREHDAEQLSALAFSGLPEPQVCDEHPAGHLLCPHETLVVAVKLARLVDWTRQHRTLRAYSLRNGNADFRLGERPHDFRDTCLSLGITNEFPDANPGQVWQAWTTA